MWVIPLLEAAEVDGKEREDDLVSVRFSDRAYKAPFLSIRTLVGAGREMKLVGSLEENHSRDILNNVRDLLAWD